MAQILLLNTHANYLSRCRFLQGINFVKDTTLHLTTLGIFEGWGMRGKEASDSEINKFEDSCPCDDMAKSVIMLSGSS